MLTTPAALQKTKSVAANASATMIAANATNAAPAATAAKTTANAMAKAVAASATSPLRRKSSNIWIFRCKPSW